MQVGNKVVYITTVTYPENTTPIKELCFVADGLTYTIALTNYTQEYTDHIFDSFRFIESSGQYIAAENPNPESLQSPLPNPLSSIYNHIILS